MPSRQFHGKTRHGCKTCKARKVRCGQEKPICANCSRLSRGCAYASTIGTSPSSSSNLSPAATLPPNLALSQSPRSHISTPDSTASYIFGLELLHHYTAFTALTEVHDPEHQRIWQVSIPRLAFSNPFLLHGIMAIAALHRRRSSPVTEQESLLDAARHHQEVALSIYIPLLNDITAKNCHPLFAFSQVIAIVSYSLLQVDREHLTVSEYIQRLVGIFELLIGASVIAIEGRNWLPEGPFAALLNSDHPLKDQNSIPVWDDSTRALESLAERIAGVSSFGEDQYSDFSLDTSKQACLFAIEKVNLLFPRSPDIRPRIDAVTGWPIFVGSGLYRSPEAR